MIVELGLPPAPAPLPAPVTDAHTHFASTHAYSGLTATAALAAAAAVNVTRFVDVGVDVASSEQAIALAATDARVVANVALHPNHAARLGTDLAEHLTALEHLVSQSGVRGIGETGLDYYRTKDTAGQRLQHESFAAHIRLAIAHDLTLVIHDRDAHGDILRVLDDTGHPERIVMHCFSGDAEFATACVARGAWLSFPGTVTFKANDALREAALATPADRILVETDAPYLTPMPNRGKPNSSYLLPNTVRFLAALLATDLAEFCGALTANAAAAFGGTWGDE